jgi:hypothetical protein
MRPACHMPLGAAARTAAVVLGPATTPGGGTWSAAAGGRVASAPVRRGAVCEESDSVWDFS